MFASAPWWDFTGRAQQGERFIAAGGII